jgi:hypothetical protein
MIEFPDALLPTPINGPTEPGKPDPIEEPRVPAAPVVLVKPVPPAAPPAVVVVPVEVSPPEFAAPPELVAPPAPGVPPGVAVVGPATPDACNPAAAPSPVDAIPASGSPKKPFTVVLFCPTRISL